MGELKMLGRARAAYVVLRRVPVLGVACSRLVWTVKGLLGRPVAVAVTPPPGPPPARRRPSDPMDVGVRIALEAAWALQARVTALEASDRGAPVGSLRSITASHGRPESWSVIVPTLDRAAWLDRALWALTYQRHANFEVIVVRGPCRDNTDAVLARHAASVRVIDCSEANIAAARNAGLRAAGGEAVAFLDDDAVPEPDWLERLGDRLRDPEAGGVGGFIRDASGVGFQCRSVVADRFGASKDMGANPGRLDPPGPQAERYLSLTGANCAFRTAALRAIGGFDEAYAYFLDETDVCLRLVEAGWRLAVSPDAEVHHDSAESAQRDAVGIPRRLIDCVRSTAYFAMRHAAPRHGLVETTERLQTYAANLARDTAWRIDHGRISPADGERMLEQIGAGLSEGVARAFAATPSVRRPSRADEAARFDPSRARGLKRPRPTAGRLRVALLSQDYRTDEEVGRPAGGIAVWSRTLAEELARRGHEVSVFARGESETRAAFHTAADGGLWVHRCATGQTAPPGRRNVVLDAAPSSVARRAMAQAAETLRVHPRRRFDLALGPLWELEPAGLLGRAPFPVAVSLHTACAQMADDRPEWDTAYRRSHVDKVIAAERRLLAAAPHVLANSATALVDLAARFGLPDLSARATVLPHGLPDLAQGVAPASRADGVEFLFVGRFERRKGIDTLLAAASRALAVDPTLRITLVGEQPPGCLEASAFDLFQHRYAGAPWLERIAWLGPLPRAELLARYAACDAVLVPSRYESFGLVALEAMIFAKPCIASDAGGLRDLVADGETGLLTAPGDADALATAILSLAANPGRRVALGAAGRRRYEGRYTAAAMADGFEAWARELHDWRRLAYAAEWAHAPANKAREGQRSAIGQAPHFGLRAWHT